MIGFLAFGIFIGIIFESENVGVEMEFYGKYPFEVDIIPKFSTPVENAECNYSIKSAETNDWQEPICRNDICDRKCKPISFFFLCPNVTYDIMLVTFNNTTVNGSTTTLASKRSVEITDIDSGGAILNMNNFTMEDGQCNITIEDSTIIVPCDYLSCPSECEKFTIFDLTPETEYKVVVPEYDLCNITKIFHTLSRHVELQVLEITSESIMVWSGVSERMNKINCTYRIQEDTKEYYPAECDNAACSSDCLPVNITNVCQNILCNITMSTNIAADQTITVNKSAIPEIINVTNIDASSAEIHLLHFRNYTAKCDVDRSIPDEIKIDCTPNGCPTSCLNFTAYNLTPSTKYKVRVVGYIKCEIKKTFLTNLTAPTGLKLSKIDERTHQLTWDPWVNAEKSFYYKLNVVEISHSENLIDNCSSIDPKYYSQKFINYSNYTTFISPFASSYKLKYLIYDATYEMQLCKAISISNYNCTTETFYIVIDEILNITVDVVDESYEITFLSQLSSQMNFKYHLFLTYEMLFLDIPETNKEKIFEPFTLISRNQVFFKDYNRFIVSEMISASQLLKFSTKLIIGKKTSYQGIWSIIFKRDFFFTGIVKACTCHNTCIHSAVFPIIKTSPNYMAILYFLILSFVTITAIFTAIYIKSWRKNRKKVLYCSELNTDVKTGEFQQHYSMFAESTDLNCKDLKYSE